MASQNPLQRTYLTPRCLRCLRQPRMSFDSGEGAFSTHICYQDCGNVYWTLNVCPFCKSTTKTIFLKQPNFGQLLRCSNCTSKMYYFKCPNKSCQAIFYKSEQIYRMGVPISCTQCKSSYRMVVCQCGCGNELPANDVLVEGYSCIICRCCKKQIIFTNCPTCNNPDYHIEKLQVGERIKCRTCKNSRVYVPCPKCGRSTPGNKFKYCDPIICNYCNCCFEYSDCPFGCGKNFHIGTFSYGPIRKCQGACKAVYFVINCKKCESPVYLQGLEQNVAQIQKCPTQFCQAKLQYYYCSCGKFNTDQPKCDNPVCPPPKKIVNKFTKESQQTKDYNQTECKICMEKPSTMINASCRHIMMCDDCFKTYAASKRLVLSLNFNPAQSYACPVCKTIGAYHKFVEPIFS